MRIKYIASYDSLDNHEENRVNCLASYNKINYFLREISDVCESVEIISTSQTLNRHFYKGKRVKIDKNIDLTLFATLPRGGYLLKAFNVFFMRHQIKKYLRKSLLKDDIIIIYHSPGNIWLLKYLLRSKFKVIEEVEEIYGDIYGKKRLSSKERKELPRASSFIFPTFMLSKIVNKENKKELIIHGAYINNKKDAVVKLSKVDGKVHVCYTGILNPKKGCESFIKSGTFLSQSFVLHILGFGNKRELDNMDKIIREINKKSCATVVFDGVRTGDSYIEYLNSMDIGICPLNSKDGFVLTQFPSKVISYLSCGIEVLCSDVLSVKTSKVAEWVHFYNGNEPESIAEAIKTVDLNNKKNNEVLMEMLGLGFKKELKKFLSEDC